MSKSRIITSFDIGIRNLAYCVMEYLPQNIPGNQFKIHDWNVIDLLEASEQQNKKCQVKYKSGSKNGQTCDNSAHYYTGDEHKLSVCKVHSKSYDPAKLNRMHTVANITLFELARLAVKELDKIDFSKSEEVIFESQPKINPKMKNFSMMLFNYFVIRYIAEKPEHLQTVKDIRFINSKNKLTVYDGPYIECKLKNQHSRNKFYGKEYCKYILRYNNERLAYFESFKKKDDLADSFLQGAWYLMSTYKSDNKIGQLPLSIIFKKDIEENSKLFKIKVNLKSKTSLPMITTSENPMAIIAQSETPVIRPKLTLKQVIKLKPVLTGKQYLSSIKHSVTTQKIKQDYNMNKYKQFKKGYKPKSSIKRYALSNIKYIIEKNNLTTSEKIRNFALNDPILIPSIKFYFTDIEMFIRML